MEWCSNKTLAGHFHVLQCTALMCACVPRPSGLQLRHVTRDLAGSTLHTRCHDSLFNAICIIIISDDRCETQNYSQSCPKMQLLLHPSWVTILVELPRRLTACLLAVCSINSLPAQIQNPWFHVAATPIQKKKKK